jgi:peptidoglycan/LPS O-acetylase OafA/YrhL
MSKWQMAPESGSILHMDCLRLIAAVGIIFVHMQGYTEGALADMTRQWSARLALFVDLFFVISGFVIAFVYSERLGTFAGYFRFLQKRIARLGPLHWATFLIFACMAVSAASAGVQINYQRILDPQCFVPNALLLHATGLCDRLSFNMVSWSVSAEFCMYIFAPAVFFLTRKSPLVGVVIAVAMWCGLTIVDPSWPSWTYIGMYRAAPSFLLGASLFGFRKDIVFPHAALAMWIALSAFLAASTLAVPITILSLMVYMIAICAIAADNSGRASRVVLFGAAGSQLTYSSYMLHMLVLTALVTVGARHVMHLHDVRLYVSLALAFIIIWPVSYASLFLFERPLRRLLTPTIRLNVPAQNLSIPNTIREDFRL